MRPRGITTVALAGLLLGLSSRAHAGTEDSIGVAPEDIALGGSAVARPGTFAAGYYNPAGLSPGGSELADPPGYAELYAGFSYAHPLVYAQRLDDGSSLPLAAQPSDTAGLTLGSRFDLGHPLGLDGLGLGLGIYVPTNGIFFWSIHADEAPTWMFLTDRTNHVGINLGLAYRIVDWLSVGLSARVMFDVEALTTGRVAQLDQDRDPQTGDPTYDVKTQLGEEVTVYGRAAPIAGLLLTPWDRLRIGLTYRAKLYVDDWGWTRIQGVPVAGDLGYAHRFAHYFHPHQGAAAVAVGVTPRWWLSADLTFSHWAEGLTTNHAALGPGRFGDTWTPAVGIEWRATPQLAVLGGYRFVPSPFDNLGGPTNLLSNDQHIGSLGGKASFGEIWTDDEGDALTLEASWALRMAWLVEREERKDPRRFPGDRHFLENPGLRAYRYGGAVPGLSLGLEVQW